MFANAMLKINLLYLKKKKKNTGENVDKTLRFIRGLIIHCSSVHMSKSICAPSTVTRTLLNWGVLIRLHQWPILTSIIKICVWKFERFQTAGLCFERNMRNKILLKPSTLFISHLFRETIMYHGQNSKTSFTTQTNNLIHSHFTHNIKYIFHSITITL